MASDDPWDYEYLKFEICRRCPWDKGLGLSDAAQVYDVIFLGET